MEIDNLSYKFKAKGFTVEMKIIEGKIEFISTH